MKKICKLPNVVSRSAAGFETSRVWYEARKRGDGGLQRLIEDTLVNTSVTVVCIGFGKGSRQCMSYEIERSLDCGHGLVGIKIHHLRDQSGVVDAAGAVPPSIESAGFKVYPYTGPERLAAHIEEAFDLAELGEVARLTRKRDLDTTVTEVENRREPRVEVADGSVQINGNTYPLKDWNSRGFSAMQYTGHHDEQDKVDITFSVSIEGREFEFSCRAVVVRVDNDKQEFVGIFVELDKEFRTAINQHFGFRSVAARNRVAANRVSWSPQAARRPQTKLGVQESSHFRKLIRPRPLTP